LGAGEREAKDKCVCVCMCVLNLTHVFPERGENGIKGLKMVCVLDIGTCLQEGGEESTSTYTHRCHEVRVSFGRRVDVHSLQPALGVVAASWILHLRNGLDHACDAHCGEVLRVVVCECLGDTVSRCVTQTWQSCTSIV
jgi:hypothetical protein